MSDRMKSRSTATRASGTDVPSSPLRKLKDRKQKGQLSWGEASPQQIQEIIWRVVDNGGLVSFSKTSDGGALVLYLKDGVDENKDYAASLDELETMLQNLIEVYATP